MPQVLNSDAELAAKRLHVTDAALTNTFAGLSTLTGSVRITGQPSCRLRNSAAQSIASQSTYTASTFDTEVGDVGGMHDSVNPSRITIPTGQGGLYLVTAATEFAFNTSGFRGCKVVLNGSTDAGPRVITSPSSSTATSVSVTHILSLSAGDFIEFVVRQTSGGSLNIGGTLVENGTTFQVIKLS